MQALAYGASGYGDELLAGFSVTITFTLVSYFFALITGFVLGVVASVRNRYLQVYWRVHASVVMGVPPLLIIFLVYYNLPLLISILLGERFEISAFVAGVVALSLNIGTYVGEVVRGAIRNVPLGHIEAARALGLPFRVIFCRVMFRQVLRLALPGLSNLWMVTLKETALVSIIGLQDIVRAARIAAGNTFQPFLFYTAVVVAFIIFGYVTTHGMRFLDSRLNAWART